MVKGLTDTGRIRIVFEGAVSPKALTVCQGMARSDLQDGMILPGDKKVFQLSGIVACAPLNYRNV